jgi:hypothetical protein
MQGPISSPLTAIIIYLPTALAVAASLLTLSWRRIGAVTNLIVLESIFLGGYSIIGALPASALVYPLAAVFLLSLLYPFRRRLAYPEATTHATGSTAWSALSLALQYITPTLSCVGAAFLASSLLKILSKPSMFIEGPLASILETLSGTLLYQALFVLILLALSLWMIRVFVNLFLDVGLLLAYKSKELASSIVAEELSYISKRTKPIGLSGAMMVGGFLLYPLEYGLASQFLPGLGSMLGGLTPLVFLFATMYLVRLGLDRMVKSIGSMSGGVGIRGFIVLALIFGALLGSLTLTAGLPLQQLVEEALIHKPVGEAPPVSPLDQLENLYLQSMRELAGAGDAIARALIFFLWGY